MNSPTRATSSAWPAISLAAYGDTLATLHRWSQLLGKTRLALSPFENHYWHIALYVTARGLTTSPMPYRDRTIEIGFDFVDHELYARTSDGHARTLALEPISVAAFARGYRELLRALDVDVKLTPIASELAGSPPLDRDHEHASYDRDAVVAWWGALVHADQALRAFRGRFLGKCSPSHFFWGSFDLACTRFSGRPAPPHPGGIPALPDAVTRESYSHECISAGWWAGTLEGPVREPVFYAYAYPQPPGLPAATLRPVAARFDTELQEWLLPYEAVRSAENPAAMVAEFLQSSYETFADLGHWDRGRLERQSGASG